MRPMTELEFEKACRGTVLPVAEEYAWGNTEMVIASGLTANLTATEETTPENANCAHYNGLEGPVRVGNFARATSTRLSSGASYYGIMELSGNLRERIVTVGNVSGRAFTGILGDGTLDTSGNANVSQWPDASAIGSGFRGGSWGWTYGDARVSGRPVAAGTDPDRFVERGFRCVMGVLP